MLKSPNSVWWILPAKGEGVGIMRIMLIATNRHNRWMTRQEVRPLPIGLAYVAAYIDQSKHDLRMVDLMFYDDYLQHTEDIVNEFNPDLIGISIRNLDNGSYINPQSALPVTKDVINLSLIHI